MNVGRFSGSKVAGVPGASTRLPLAVNFWRPSESSFENFAFALSRLEQVGGGGGGSGIAAAPNRTSASGTTVNAWIGAKGVWKVSPPSRLNEQVSRSVVSSKVILSTMGPVIAEGSIET